MMRTSLWMASVAVLLSGCSGESPVATPPLAGSDPVPSIAWTPTGSAGLGKTAMQGDQSISAFALFTLEIDPESLAATSHLKATRTAQATDDIYLLDIGNFTTPSTLQVRSIGITPTTVTIGYTITHPFAAPSNLDGPASAANRADLGISGRVLFLADVSSGSGNTYFTNVIANTALITDADAYYKPEGLLSLTGFNANTFPYKRLVDEAQNSRTSSATGVAIGNGGQPDGNYSTADGWQRSNIGSGNAGWTGYGVLHQGQTAANSLTLDRAALATGGFSFDAAIIAKYEDPRGGTNGAAKKANRLPANPADVTKFVYREPHGALDVERVEFLSATGDYVTNQISASTLAFRVTDWDARATESAQTDLALDPDPTNVEIGEAGTPALAVSIPGVTGDATSFVTLAEAPDNDDSAVGGDAAQDSGIPGDALYYSELVTKIVVSGQSSGTFTGLVRATDPEADLATRDWYFPLKADLSGAATPAPRPETYQVLSVAQIVPNDAPTLTATTPANVVSGTTTIVTITSANDNDGEAITIELDWANDGTYEDTRVINPPYTVPVVYTRPASATYNNATLTAESRIIKLRYSDGVIGSPINHPDLSFTLGANRPPVVSGTPVLAATPLLPPATFAMNVGTATATDPEGNAITYKVTANVAPNGPFPSAAGQAAFPIGSLGAYATPGSVIFTVHAQDPLHQNTIPAQPNSTTTYPTVTGTVQPPCPTAPFVATGIVAPIGYTGNAGFWSINSAGAHMQDVEALKTTNFAANGGVIVQRKEPSLDGELYRFTSNAVAPNSCCGGITALSVGFPTTTQVNQLDTSATNRIFYSTYITPQPDTARQNPAYTYGATGAATNIGFFDYTGSAVTFASHQVLSTGTNRVVAMEVDQAGNIWFIDTANVLHKMIPAGATYTEVVTAPYPLDLKNAPMNMNPAGGTAATNIKVHDFEVNEYSGRFFILAQSREAASTPGNGYLYSVSCDGTASSRSTAFALNYSTTQDQSGDIHIDQRTTTGALITPLSNVDRQIVIFGNRMIPNTDPEPEIRIFTANLVQTTSRQWDPLGCCDIGWNNGSIGLDNWAYGMAGPTLGTGMMQVYGSAGNFPPAGWQ